MVEKEREEISVTAGNQPVCVTALCAAGMEAEWGGERETEICLSLANITASFPFQFQKGQLFLHLLAFQ